MTDEEMAVNWIRSQGWSEENLPSDEFLEKMQDYHYEEIKLEHFPHPRIEGQFCTIALYPTSCFESMARDCEVVRRKYLQTKNEHYFDILVRLLPNSYKVVKL